MFDGSKGVRGVELMVWSPVWYIAGGAETGRLNSKKHDPKTFPQTSLAVGPGRQLVTAPDHGDCGRVKHLNSDILYFA